MRAIQLLIMVVMLGNTPGLANDNDDKLREMAKKYVILFYYTPKCVHCHDMASKLAQFVEKYDFYVQPVTNVAQEISPFTHYEIDQDSVIMGKVRHFPTLFACDPSTGAVIQLSDGIISMVNLKKMLLKIGKQL